MLPALRNSQAPTAPLEPRAPTRPRPVAAADRVDLESKPTPTPATYRAPAPVRFEQAVDRILARYERDLGLSPAELASLRRHFLEEVARLPEAMPAIASAAATGAALPEALAGRVRQSIAEMRARIEARRDPPV